MSDGIANNTSALGLPGLIVSFIDVFVSAPLGSRCGTSQSFHHFTFKDLKLTAIHVRKHPQEVSVPCLPAIWLGRNATRREVYPPSCFRSFL